MKRSIVREDKIAFLKSKKVIGEDRNPVKDYKVRVTIPVDEAANILGYKLDRDFEPNWTSYDPKSIFVGSKFDGAELYFPDAVVRAANDADQSAIEAQIYKETLSSIEDAFQKIDPGTVEYIGEIASGDQYGVSAKAGVLSASVDQNKGEVEIEILNPQHLINGIVSGVGLMGPDIAVDMVMNANDVKKYLHNLVDYFEVWGERKPEQYSDRVADNAIADQKYFEEQLAYHISETTLDEVVDTVSALMDEEGDLDVEEVASQVEKLSKGSIKAKDLLAKLPSIDAVPVESKALKEQKNWNKESIIAELVSHFASGDDEKDKELETEISDSLELPGGRWDSWTDDTGKFEANGDEYNFFLSEDDAERIAIRYVKDQLEEEPENFTPSFIQQHLYISPTDRRLIAVEEADARAEDFRYDLKKENFDEVFEQVGSYESEYEALKEKLEKAEESDDEDAVDSVKKEIVKLAEKAIDEWSSDYADDLEAKLEKDPKDYFINELGAYTEEEFLKLPFVNVDAEEASKEAVKIDGWAHFLSHYDSDYIETQNGLVLMRE